jgi:hypothetical protein
MVSSGLLRRENLKSYITINFHKTNDVNVMSQLQTNSVAFSPQANYTD